MPLDFARLLAGSATALAISPEVLAQAWNDDVSFWSNVRTLEYWIDRARAKVDWIILDASPLLKSFANVAPLAPLATDVIVVSNPVLTTPAKLRAGIALLQPMMSSRALRGLVINGG